MPKNASLPEWKRVLSAAAHLQQLLPDAEQLGEEQTAEALKDFDRLYPQPNEASALQQLQIQLANPLPYDLEETRLTEYKSLAPKWHDWKKVAEACAHCATAIFERASASETERKKKKKSK